MNTGFSLKLVFVFLAIMLATLFAQAQKPKFAGNWLLIKVDKNGVVEDENTEFLFKKDGLVSSSGFDFAKWHFNATAMEINLASPLSEDEFNGIHKIKQLTNKQLVFSQGGRIYYFKRINEEQKRIDAEKTGKTNEVSGLAGTWKLNHKVFDQLFLKLELPETFKFISCASGTTTSTKGQWHYLPETKELELTGVAEGEHFILKGKNRVKDHSAGFLALVTARETLLFDKKDKSDIEWLTFSADEFKSHTNDENLLPKVWRNNASVISHLAKLQRMVYHCKTYVPEAEALKNTRTILRKVDAKPEKGSVSIANIMITKYDTLQYSENYMGNMMNQNNYFFPEEEPGFYRVTGIEKYEGYECTVIEAVSDNKILKLWMINNQPGVYAKIIEQGKHFMTNETEYHVISLLRTY
ncbi:hypothetical protein [Marinifilum flexuosum]|uniref:Lipocalin-like protein n=1 Tax=Marinifilum flexuosum TaxID=1117708 RepID=A0A419X7G8_9BACT|nr:hypothetical protein [Marinifilum flexuosum]RKE03635.1 hypothetical protein BXY64_0644 [Marinifilum flexuosum]